MCLFWYHRSSLSIVRILTYNNSLTIGNSWRWRVIFMIADDFIWSYDSTMGIRILVRQHLNVENAPKVENLCQGIVSKSVFVQILLWILTSVIKSRRESSFGACVVRRLSVVFALLQLTSTMLTLATVTLNAFVDGSDAAIWANSPTRWKIWSHDDYRVTSILGTLLYALLAFISEMENWCITKTFNKIDVNMVHV